MVNNVSVKHEFECSYLVRLPGTSRYELNSHRYRVEVSVVGPQRYADYGYIIDFNKLKNYVSSKVPDKSFIINSADMNISEFKDIVKNLTILGVPIVSKDIGEADTISAEHILDMIVKDVQVCLDTYEPGIYVANAVLRENSQFAVEYNK